MSSRNGRIARSSGARWVALVAVLALVTGSIADEPKHDFTVVDSASIYYGTKKHPKTPAQCDADSVWSEIPEYKTIIDDELGPDDPKYHLLLKRATKRFQRALKKLAKRDDYDVIGEVGAIKANGKKSVPTVTSDLIDYVTRD